MPFVARYRKEATGGLDDTQLRTLADRLVYLREMEARRETILGSIREQGKLTPELEGRSPAPTTKAVLEDLYLPYKPKRRTKAMIARERGSQGLADAILADRAAAPEALAAGFLSDEVPDAKEALAGARDILTEQLAEDAAPDRAAARLSRARRRGQRAGRRRAGGEGGEVLRLFRPFREVGGGAEPPGAGDDARRERGRADRRHRAGRRRRSRGSRRWSRARSASPATGPATAGSPAWRAGRGR